MNLAIVILLSNLLLFVSSLYYFLMLQQNSYNENRKYFHFINDDVLYKYATIYIFMLVFSFLLVIYEDFPLYLLIFYIISLLILILSFRKIYKTHNKKLPLKITSRVKRIMALDYALFIVYELVMYYLMPQTVSYAGAVLMYIAFHPYILIIVVLLLTPVEKMIFNHYKKEALAKLNKMPNLKVIGITGSFGKTSTKMILNTILNTTYKGFYTPASFNTPNGLLITINKEKTIFNDYFISEMGAKKVGEIKELCDLVYPKYGILTSIGPAHLETFKSLENIQKTKFELIESLPSDGIAILNKDDEYQRSYKLKNKVKTIWIGIENEADVMAKDIKVTSSGTTFKIYFKEDNSAVEVSTILLGNKNIYNILSACALARALGVNDKALVRGVKEIKPISHRLEIKNAHNMTIIDDSFNSNPVGAKNAVDVLGLFNTKKIIITPGMIEMGEKQEELNKTFGTQIAKVADEVYLIGPKQTKPIYEGLIQEGYKEENIKVKNSFNEAFNEVKASNGNKNITVLFENDLPDSYMEGK